MTMYTFEKNWRGMKFRMIEKLKRITNKMKNLTDPLDKAKIAEEIVGLKRSVINV